MIWIILAVGLSASIMEAYLDRHGESRKEKFQQSLVLSALLCAVALVVWWACGVNPLKTVALILAVRILVFDYIVSYLLIRNKVIVGNWFTYTGKTSRWDRIVSKISPTIRLVIRLILLAGALVLFFSF